MNKTEKIPFLDLITPHEELKEELCAGFEKALTKGAFVGGAAVEGFEKDFAQFCDTEHCVGVGTDHSAFNYKSLVRDASSIVDTRNALKGIASEKIFRL